MSLTQAKATHATITDQDVEYVNSISVTGGYWSVDLAPVPPSQRKWGLRDVIAKGGPVCMHSNLHVGLFNDRRGDELAAGSSDHFPGQSDCSHSDGSQRSRWNQVWNSFSSSL